MGVVRVVGDDASRVRVLVWWVSGFGHGFVLRLVGVALGWFRGGGFPIPVHCAMVGVLRGCQPVKSGAPGVS